MDSKGLSVGQPVAACGGLWRPVAACGTGVVALSEDGALQNAGWEYSAAVCRFVDWKGLLFAVCRMMVLEGVG